MPDDVDISTLPDHAAAAAEERPVADSSNASASGAEMVGRLIEGYRVVREVGRGAMGAVYEAVHEKIGQRAAIKVMFPQNSGDRPYVRRFLSEARAAVAHPGLVKVFNHGQCPDGTLYILMEFLQGESLRARLVQRGRLSQEESLRIAGQIASALCTVHSHNIIHRDLKPANVMLVQDPDVAGGERTKVVDFGIAKIPRLAGTADETATAAAAFIGTATYASPEQCKGGPIDGRSDVYSLGIMLYEMLAGRPPFAGAPATVIGMHILSSPRPLVEVAPEVQDGLCALVHEMLAKEPAGRPYMDQVRLRLEEARQGRASPWQWLRRRRRAIISGLAAAALVGLAAWGIMAVWAPGRRQPVETSPPVQPSIPAMLPASPLPPQAPVLNAPPAPAVPREHPVVSPPDDLQPEPAKETKKQVRAQPTDKRKIRGGDRPAGPKAPAGPSDEERPPHVQGESSSDVRATPPAGDKPAARTDPPAPKRPTEEPTYQRKPVF